MNLTLTPVEWVLFVAALVCLAVFFFAVVRLVSVQEKLETSVGERFESLTEQVGDLERRVHLVQGHALDYMNSMSSESSRALYELQLILASQQKVIAEIEQEIAKNDSESLRRADLLLTQTIERATASIDDPAHQHDGLDHWASRSEELLQLLGFDISLASQSAHDSGLRPGRKRNKTRLNLKEAGILAALRAELKK